MSTVRDRAHNELNSVVNQMPQTVLYDPYTASGGGGGSVTTRCAQEGRPSLPASYSYHY